MACRIFFFKNNMHLERLCAPPPVHQVRLGPLHQQLGPVGGPQAQAGAAFIKSHSQNIYIDRLTVQCTCRKCTCATYFFSRPVCYKLMTHSSTCDFVPDRLDAFAALPDVAA